MVSKVFKNLQISVGLLAVVLFHHAQCQTECAPEAMSRCTDPLKVVTDNKDLGFATSIEELQEMCPKLMEGLRCIDEFTMKCLDREHRAYFNTLYAGTTQVIIDLCQEGEYQRDYLRHAPCMRHVQNGYEKCAAEYQVRIKSLNEKSQKEDDGTQPKVAYEYYDEAPEGQGGGVAYEYEPEAGDVPSQETNANSTEETKKEVKEKDLPKRTRRQAPAATSEYVYDEAQPDPEENVRLLCCSFQRYLHCSESVVNITCGVDTAKFTKSFLDRMSGPLIQGHCQAYEFSSDSCDVNEKFPWAEYTNNDHVSHYSNSKTAEPFSGSNFNFNSLFLSISCLLLLLKLY